MCEKSLLQALLTSLVKGSLKQLPVVFLVRKETQLQAGVSEELVVLFKQHALTTHFRIKCSANTEFLQNGLYLELLIKTPHALPSFPVQICKVI